MPAMSEFSLPLGLPFELWLRQLDTDNSDQAFLHVVAGEIFLHVLEEAERLASRVDGARQRRAKARQVRAAIDRVDVVRVAEDGVGIAVVILQRDVDLDVLAGRFHMDRLFVQDRLGPCSGA